MSQTLSAQAALDRHYLETRCKIIEIAANLDRIDGGAGAASVRADARLTKIREAINAILDDKGNRTERCQMIFSLPYDADWRPPNRA